ncbi:MAG: alanyl-tRNA editing protein [Gemmatimonadales bacterium]|nr:alanyl-tRNA editing protein [Gemmatimonadales bacterium]
MTERLYYADAYLREFEANVVDSADEGRRLYLDRTAFYPTSGGQPHDLGRLGGVEVVDVVDEGDRVAHLLEAPLTDARVLGRLDWERRFDHMQQHTGQHLLSAVIAELFGYETVAVHFGREGSTLDLETGALSHEEVVAAEARANAVAVENRPVEVSFDEAGSAIALRRASSREGTLRIVTIRDLDRSACGGTHVGATGEIGPLLVRAIGRVKQRVRVEFLCGARVVRRVRADLDLLGRIAGSLSAAPVELPAILDAQRRELKESAAARRGLEEALDRYRARELYDGVAPGPSGTRRVVLREERAGIERLRGIARAVTELPRAVFVGTVAGAPTVLVAASEDSGVDAGRVLQAALEPAGGRGGGSARLAQGSAPVEMFSGVVETLLNRTA